MKIMSCLLDLILTWIAIYSDEWDERMGDRKERMVGDGEDEGEEIMR